MAELKNAVKATNFRAKETKGGSEQHDKTLKSKRNRAENGMSTAKAQIADTESELKVPRRLDFKKKNRINYLESTWR